MIKAVIFDYFGVICSDEYWQFVKQDKNMDREFSKLSDAVNLGTLHWQDFLAKIAAKTDRPLEEVMRLYASERVNPVVLAYISQLRQHYKTALLTNAHWEYIEPMIDKANLRNVFDVIVISSRVGVIKPAPEIFRYTLDKLGVKAEEAVMVDDISRHIEGAARVGLKTVYYQTFPQMKHDLEAILGT